MKIFNVDKKILVDAFTYRKILILNTLNYLINDTITPIPLLSTESKIKGIVLKGYLEKKTKLNGRSLYTFYFNTLMNLNNNGIVKIINKNGKKLRYFTEIGLRIKKFFNSIINFFGEENFLSILDKRRSILPSNKSFYLQNPVRKSIFLYVLAKVIDLHRIQVNEKSEFRKDRDLFLKKYHREKSGNKFDLNLEKEALYVKLENIKNYIKDTTPLPASIDRRNKLFLSIEKSFTELLGENLKKKKIIDFEQLRGIFEEWDFLPIKEKFSYKTPTGFESKISSIISEGSKPLYALNIGNSLKFGSEFHSNEKVSFDLRNIKIFIEYLNNHYLNFSQKDLKIIEITIPLMESGSIPRIYYIPIKDGIFLLTAYRPLYWSNFESNLEFTAFWPESPSEVDNAYFITKKSFKNKYLKDSDSDMLISTIINLIHMIIILVDDIYFHKMKHGFIDFQTLRENWKYDVNLWNSFESKFKEKIHNLEKTEIEQNPIFNSENFCCAPFPKVKIYYDKYLIKCGATIKEGKIYFSLYSTNNTASFEFNEIFKLLKKFYITNINQVKMH